MTTLDRADVPTAVTPPTTTTNAPRSRPAALVAALATFRAIGGGLLVVDRDRAGFVNSRLPGSGDADIHVGAGDAYGVVFDRQKDITENW